MLAGAAIFIFWTIFFGLLSVKEFVFPQANPIDERFRRVLEPVGLRAVKELLVSNDETAGMKRLKKTLLLAGLKRRSDLEK